MNKAKGKDKEAKNPQRKPGTQDDLARLFDAFSELNKNVSVIGTATLERRVRELFDTLQDRIKELEALMIRMQGDADLRRKQDEAQAIHDRAESIIKKHKGTGCDDCDSGTFCYVHNGGRRR